MRLVMRKPVLVCVLLAFDRSVVYVYSLEIERESERGKSGVKKCINDFELHLLIALVIA